MQLKHRINMILRIIDNILSSFYELLKKNIILPINSFINFPKFCFVKNNRNKSAFSNLTFIILTITIINLSHCSHLSVHKEKDNMGRIIRSVSTINDATDTIITIKYIGKTDKPLSKEYIKIKNEVPFHSWLETYGYNKGKISIIKYIVNINNNKVQSGEIIYEYTKENPNRIEYYSLLKIKKSMNPNLL